MPKYLTLFTRVNLKQLKSQLLFSKQAGKWFSKIFIGGIETLDNAIVINTVLFILHDNELAANQVLILIKSLFAANSRSKLFFVFKNRAELSA